MATKCLIIGAKGMLGSELSVVFQEYNPVCWDIDDIDITKKDLVETRLAELKPDLIINAAAYTNVDGAEENRSLANLVNGEAVGYLAAAANKIGATLIHYSTDYVFNGQLEEGCLENSLTDPVNAYGESKEIGEREIVNNCKRYYLIRTSWLYGKNGKNFVDTMITLGNENDEVRVVNDQYGKPTYAVDLAQRTLELVNTNAKPGIYHITNEGVTSWYGFAKEIFQQKNIVTRVVPVHSNEFPRPAKRPKFSSLINTKLPLSRSWKEALADYFKGK